MSSPRRSTFKSFYLELPCPSCEKTIAYSFIKSDLRKAMKGKRELVRYKAYLIE